MTPEADRMHIRLLSLDWGSLTPRQIAEVAIEAAKLIREQAEEIERLRAELSITFAQQ
jgi:hypothetical protein